jgi:hypothetical protein
MPRGVHEFLLKFMKKFRRIKPDFVPPSAIRRLRRKAQGVGVTAISSLLFEATEDEGRVFFRGWREWVEGARKGVLLFHLFSYEKSNNSP